MDDMESLLSAGRKHASCVPNLWQDGDHARVAAQVSLTAAGSDCHCCALRLFLYFLSVISTVSFPTLKVARLETQGCTALGPALAYAVGMASGIPGSTEIVLCTDGMVCWRGGTVSAFV